jgi:hypothetical protein
MDGLINLLVVLALTYVLIKIPIWILGPLRVSNGRSMIGGLARAYVMGRALGAVAGRGSRATGMRAGGAARGAARSRTAVADPPSGMPIREWGGLGGIYSPEAIGRRLRDQQEAERERAGTGSGVDHPRFVQPIRQTPTHDLATRHAYTAPTAAEFRAADGTMSTASGQPVVPPTPRRRTRPPQRRYPPFSAPGAPSARRPAPTLAPPMPLAATPPELRFQPATPAPHAQPIQVTNPAKPPVFQSPTPDNGVIERRARTETPAAPIFQPPPIPSTETQRPDRRSEQ